MLSVEKCEANTTMLHHLLCLVTVVLLAVLIWMVTRLTSRLRTCRGERPLFLSDNRPVHQVRPVQLEQHDVVVGARAEPPHLGERRRTGYFNGAADPELGLSEDDELSSWLPQSAAQLAGQRHAFAGGRLRHGQRSSRGALKYTGEDVIYFFKMSLHGPAAAWFTGLTAMTRGRSYICTTNWEGLKQAGGGIGAMQITLHRLAFEILVSIRPEGRRSMQNSSLRHMVPIFPPAEPQLDY